MAYLLNKRRSEGRMAYERKEENPVRTDSSEMHLLYSYCHFTPQQKSGFLTKAEYWISFCVICKLTRDISN